MASIPMQFHVEKRRNGAGVAAATGVFVAVCGATASASDVWSSTFTAPRRGSATPIVSSAPVAETTATRIRLAPESWYGEAPRLATIMVALAAAGGTVGARRLRRCMAGGSINSDGRRALPRETRLKAFEEENGAIPPLGFWDPLGLSRDGDVAEFKRRREAEIKNGRVAMYATLGYMVPEFIGKLPGYLSPSEDILFRDVPNGLAAVEKVPLEGWLQILAWCGFLETVVNQPQHPTEPGNFYKGRLGIFWNKIIKDPKDRRDELNKELSNGRLAMVAITGMLFQNGVTGTTESAMWFPQ
mmetsp:Transcript_3925/g.10039  ORF Transcript_3925/g.10039 Transcript_3925/m.10039 type:complete len:300 (+) Transcript_3925:85-984(+)